MSPLLWNQMPSDQQSEYKQILQIIGSLSNLFSDNTSPYLYYRAHENLFCRVFDAKNLSRGDISFDAVKSKYGIGLKTFLHGNGKTYQKVAEFNSDSNLIRNLDSIEDIVVKVARMRNKRIDFATNSTKTNSNLYHLITREPNKMNIFETEMHKIDINSIKLNKTQHKNTIKFSDKYNEYSFSQSKNTLLQRFDTTNSSPLGQIHIDILDDPFEFLLANHQSINKYNEDYQQENEHIILPLYSKETIKDKNTKDTTIIKKVFEKSGLNQWNAGGRERNNLEVYIPIPRWIHKKFPDFFGYNKDTNKRPKFLLELPNSNVLKAKVCQQGGKALMSDPNKALGEWLIQDLLKVKPGVLITMEDLDSVGVDSVKLTKIKDDYYQLDFCETNRFEEFENIYNS